MSRRKHPAFQAYLHRLYTACEGTLPHYVLEQLFAWESIDDKDSALSYIFGALVEAGVVDPEQFLKEKEILE